ncbi:uncharacterized protein LOC121369660 [Gigantopelta aegis]|uniref:uncharacterized protein LOC121369660 n=1 Tax=Gigantopelta aegis TaxID=1735272 RepID=UPI001B88B6BF|nr:uncharacterized protein LOC121369660 [Gigantopelta aegis]
MKNCLLISNETEDHLVTLYIYSKYDPICWLSHSSIIIRPGQREYYETDDTFRYEVATRRRTSKKAGTLIPVQKYTGDKHIIVKKSDDGESCQTVEEHLDADNRDKRICIRRRNFAQQSSFRGGRDLYEILQLDMKKVRKQSTEEQNRMIKQARDRQIRRWHPDHNPENANENIAKEINFAFAILHDPESRARYNNAIDYDSGWLSKSRWRAIFWPHCETKEQKCLYRQRMLQMVISSGLFFGGLILSLATGGLATPVVVTCDLLGGALAGAGLQSGSRMLGRDCIENGCDWKTYVTRALIGGVAGAAASGAGVAIAGRLASTAAVSTAAKGACVGAVSGAVGGAVYGLANEMERINADKEEWTVTQVLGHTVAGALIGGTFGAVAGAVAGKLATETDALEMAAVKTGAKRLRMKMAKAVRTNVTNNVTMSVRNSVSGFIEERTDDTRENRPLVTHLKNGFIDVVLSVTTAAATSVAGSLVSHAMYELKVKIKVKEYLQKLGVTKKVATETDASEMAAVNTGAKRLGMKIVEALKTNVTDNVIMSVRNSVSGFIIERIYYTSENRLLETHLKDGFNDVVQSVTTAAATSVASSLVSHAVYELKVKINVKEDPQREGVTKIEATETDAPEMTAVNTSAKRLRMRMAEALITNITDNVTMSMRNSVSGFIEERTDDTRENRPLKTHLKDGFIDVAQSATTAAATSVAGSLFSHAMYEQTVKTKVIENLQREEGITKKEATLKYESMTQNDQEAERRKAREHVHVETKTFPFLRSTDAKQRTISVSDSSYQEETNPLSPVKERILFISEGLWKSEMIIKYNTKRIAREKVLNHGESFYIPFRASDITIQFKVSDSLGVKCDLTKWDRFHDKWYSETHVLRYQTPQTRTFTIGGELYYEKILKITNELYDETNEL